MYYFYCMNLIEPGTLLVSDPFLQDPNFLRSVVLICEHDDDGTVGFVINKQHNQNLNELVDKVGDIHFPVFYGGPVETDTLHYLHTKPHLISGGIEIGNNIYWGGNATQVFDLIKTRTLTPRDIRFYLGYSGWGNGQLETEIAEKSWLLHKVNRRYVFNLNADSVWKNVLTDMGGEYKQLVNYPINPQLN